jgi:hypothetical protein
MRGTGQMSPQFNVIEGLEAFVRLSIRISHRLILVESNGDAQVSKLATSNTTFRYCYCSVVRMRRFKFPPPMKLSSDK